jgi:hypothetical protein
MAQYVSMLECKHAYTVPRHNNGTPAIMNASKLHTNKQARLQAITLACRRPLIQAHLHANTKGLKHACSQERMNSSTNERNNACTQRFCTKPYLHTSTPARKLTWGLATNTKARVKACTLEHNHACTQARLLPSSPVYMHAFTKASMHEST